METYEIAFFFITAAIFTVFGYVVAIRTQTNKIAANIIDRLIEQGFLKTKGDGKGDDTIIIKHDED